MPMFDYNCPKCNHKTEELVVHARIPVTCSECGEVMEKYWKTGPPTLVNIIPSYPGCKANKAGYVHTHGKNRSATKVQSGYGGCVNPKV
jgi:putative FmdB family regulatory protein